MIKRNKEAAEKAAAATAEVVDASVSSTPAPVKKVSFIRIIYIEQISNV